MYDIDVQRIDPCKNLSWYKYGYDIYQSPLVVPEVQEAIDSANIECLRGSECHHLFVELYEVKKTSPIGWQLALNLMSLVTDQARFSSSGLVNRERVLGIMFGLEETFLE